MASAAAASSGARRLSRLFSATKPRAQKQKPDLAPTTKALTGKPNEPNPSQQRWPMRRILREIFWERDPDQLESKFVAYSARARFRSRHRVYEVAVSRLATYGRHDVVATIIEAQKPFLDVEKEGFAARLIGLYGRASMPSHAAATFHDLPPQHKSVLVFNALLSAYMRSGDFPGLATVFQEIPVTYPTIVPNVTSYNILIIALCKMSDLSAALDAVALMEKRGISPDILSFNALLCGFYSNGHLDDVHKVWEMMKERNIEPDTKSYNAKLRGFLAKGRIQDAAAVFEMMEKDGPKPDTASYNELIRGYCKEGRMDDANKLYDDLVVHDQCAPNSVTFRTILPHLLEAGDLDRALNCCYQSFSSKGRVDASLLQDMVTALVDASKVKEAQRIVKLGRAYYSKKLLKMPNIGENNDVEDESGGEDSILHEESSEEEVMSRNA